MNDPVLNPRANEMDARNRAAAYTQQAQQETDQKQQLVAERHATDFQQMLWMKNLDQTYARDLQAQLQAHEMSLRSADHRAAIELEAQKRQTALELRRLEIESSKGLKGFALSPEKTSEPSQWQSKFLQTVILASLPLIIPAILAAILRTPALPPKARRRRVARRKRQRPFVAAYSPPISTTPIKYRRMRSWQRKDLKA